MSKEKFTPGPWVALGEEVDKDYIRIRGTKIGERYKIANVLTPVYPGAHAREAEETRANAALIEAAPDLYALLSEARQTLEMWKDVAPAVSLCYDIDKTLAKVNGEGR